MSQFLFRMDAIFVLPWMLFVIYRTYRYYKKSNFNRVLPWHFIRRSLWFFCCGHLSVMLFFGWQYLYFLPFMPFGALIIRWWYELNAIALFTGIAFPFLFLPSVYYLLIKPNQNNPRLVKILLTLFWIGLFIGGGASFLYVRSWSIF
jgi:hypothetical protein